AGAPLDEAASAFLARAAGYVLKRRLFRSVSKGMAAADGRWLRPFFPRFYDYDVLRGLTFLASWAARTGGTVDGEAIAEAVDATDAFFRDPAAAPRAPDVERTRRLVEGEWRVVSPPGTFPLLEAAMDPAIGKAVLAARWRRA